MWNAQPIAGASGQLDRWSRRLNNTSMRNARTWYVLVAVGALLGCGGPLNDSAAHTRSFRQHFSELGKEVPSYGGLGRSDDRWMVYTRDSARQIDAESAVARIFGTERARSFTVGVRPARGTASEAMKVQAREVLSAGAHSLDYDELSGYLRIVIPEPDPVIVTRVTETLSAAGVPVDQAIIEVGPEAIAF